MKENIKALADRIVSDGRLTLKEHKLPLKKINADGKMDQEEHDQVTGIPELVKKGDLKISAEWRRTFCRCM